MIPRGWIAGMYEADKSNYTVNGMGYDRGIRGVKGQYLRFSGVACPRWVWQLGPINSLSTK